MSNQEILTKVIEKAIAGGWNDGEYFKYRDKVIINGERIVCGPDVSEHWNTVIFNHGFAKALWGDLPEIAYQYHTSIFRKDDQLIVSGARLQWQYHLQQMVIADNPIKYLGDNI